MKTTKTNCDCCKKEITSNVLSVKFDFCDKICLSNSIVVGDKE